MPNYVFFISSVLAVQKMVPTFAYAGVKSVGLPLLVRHTALPIVNVVGITPCLRFRRLRIFPFWLQVVTSPLITAGNVA